jgi:PadR family transcriptional regulator PadR
MEKSLGELEQMVLYAILSLGEEAYGASIRREIEARTGRDVSSGAVYTVLERLERAGLVSSRVGEPSPRRGGRRRKHYRLRPDGVRSLHRARLRMQRMAEGLEGALQRLVRDDPLSSADVADGSAT